jgi:hypothetical protein
MKGWEFFEGSHGMKGARRQPLSWSFYFRAEAMSE